MKEANMGIRERIIRAYQELSAHRGFSGVTVDEVAAHARVSKRTIYRYFDSKDDIIAAVVDEFLQAMEQEFDRLIKNGNSTQEILSSIIKKLVTDGKFIFGAPNLRDLQQVYPHIWEKIDSFRTEKFMHLLSVLREKGEVGILLETDPRIVSAIFVAIAQSVVTPEFIIKNDLTFEDTLSQVSRIMMAAMGLK